MPDDYREIINQAVKRWKLDVPMRKCDVCNVTRLQDHMINFAFIIGSPGHPDLPAFQCQHNEHWACSIAHLLDIIDHCCKTEMVNMLAYMHSVLLPEQNKDSIHYEEATSHLESQGIVVKPDVSGNVLPLEKG